MEIKTGGMDLLESETFLAVGDGETVITIREDPDVLRFILNFVEAEGEKKMGLNFEAVDKKTLKVNLTNWSNPLGTTFIEPIEVGTYRKRRLFMLVNISKAGERVYLREVTFSLYLGKEVQDGHN